MRTRFGRTKQTSLKKWYVLMSAHLPFELSLNLDQKSELLILVSCLAEHEIQINQMAKLLAIYLLLDKQKNNYLAKRNFSQLFCRKNVIVILLFTDFTRTIRALLESK